MLHDKTSNQQEGKGKEWHSASDSLYGIIWKRVSSDQRMGGNEWYVEVCQQAQDRREWCGSMSDGKGEGKASGKSNKSKQNRHKGTYN